MDSGLVVRQHLRVGHPGVAQVTLVVLDLDLEEELLLLMMRHLATA